MPITDKVDIRKSPLIFPNMMKINLVTPCCAIFVFTIKIARSGLKEVIKAIDVNASQYHIISLKDLVLFEINISVID